MVHTFSEDAPPLPHRVASTGREMLWLTVTVFAISCQLILRVLLARPMYLLDRTHTHGPVLNVGDARVVLAYGFGAISASDDACVAADGFSVHHVAAE